MTSFADFARDHGLLLERPVPDGRIRRTPTAGHPRSDNGSYRYTGDWGWVCNWEISDAVHVWREREAPQIRPSAPRAARVPPAVARVMAEDAARREKAAKRAEEIVRSCQLAKHAYMARKGFPDAMVLVAEDGRMVVPMRHFADARRLQSVQFIDAEGDKKFLPGGAAAEAVHTLGPVGAPETWLVEGYATGATVQYALAVLHRRARVMVCFSAGNLTRVAPQLKGYVRVVADHDPVAAATGKSAGIEAAKATGKPWCIPEKEGTDANDLYVRQGIRAVAEMLRSIL